MSAQADRIYSANYGPVLTVVRVPDDQETGDPRLEITADAGDQGVTIALDLFGVTKLRRSLQRHEKAMKAGEKP